MGTPLVMWISVYASFLQVAHPQPKPGNSFSFDFAKSRIWELSNSCWFRVLMPPASEKLCLCCVSSSSVLKRKKLNFMNILLKTFEAFWYFSTLLCSQYFLAVWVCNYLLLNFILICVEFLKLTLKPVYIITL